MSATYELEQELAHEFAHEASPPAHEVAHEQEGEHEAFFNSLAAMGARTGRPQALRKIALAAAQAALRTQPPPPPGIEGEFEGELEGEFEATGASSPAQIDAMLEHLGHNAAEAANEQEAAEHFSEAVPLARRVVMPVIARTHGATAARAAAPAIRRVTPALTRAVSNATRAVFRAPAARPLLHAVPRIARTTVAHLARQAAHGRPITPRTAIRTLARATYRTLSNPRLLTHAYRRSLRADSLHHNRLRRYVGLTPAHRVNGPRQVTTGHPGYRYGRWPAWYRRRYYGPRYYGGYYQPGYRNGGAPAGTVAQPLPATAGVPVTRRYRRGYGGAIPTGTTQVPVPAGAVLTGISYQYSLPRRY